jgi:hypothetical protein
LLVDGTSDPGEVDGCTFLGFHTILLDFGGVVVDFKAASFVFHTILFFFGGVGIGFGASFEICLIFFCFAFFLISFFLLIRLSTS